MTGVGPAEPDALLPESALLGHAEQERASTAPTKAAGLEALFTEHYSSVWRLLRRFGVPAAQLDDASQEVFWVAARRLSDIAPGRERAFLYGVALRAASNVLRRESARPPTTELEGIPDLADRGPSPEQALEQRQARELLDLVLERLPLKLRTVFILAELEDLPVKEIAELEGIPIGTASSRLRRAREEFAGAVRRLRAAMSARGGAR